MVRAVWNGVKIAESDKTVVIEGNHYFPPDSVDKNFLKSSATITTCPWKGDATYYSIVVDDQTNDDAAWAYSTPKPKAENIKDYVAFWRGVEIQTD